jgi:hypothetical protein
VDIKRSAYCIPAQRKEEKVFHYYGDSRRNADGTWKHGLDSRDRDPTLQVEPNYDDWGDHDCSSYDNDDYSRDCYSVGSDSFQLSHSVEFLNKHWLIDSGCSDHIIPFESDFTVLGDDTKYVRIADGNSIKMIGPGIVLLKAVG